MSRVLTAVIWINIGVVLALHILNAVMGFVVEGFFGGLSRLQETYSPFNIMNWLVTVIAIVPAIIAALVRAKLNDGRIDS